MTIYSFDIFPEPCCELCNEVIHNHMDCPICKDDYASTDCYGRIYDYVVDTKHKILVCWECKAEFKLINHESWDMDEWKWEHINFVKNVINT